MDCEAAFEKLAFDVEIVLCEDLHQNLLQVLRLQHHLVVEFEVGNEAHVLSLVELLRSIDTSQLFLQNYSPLVQVYLGLLQFADLFPDVNLMLLQSLEVLLIPQLQLLSELAVLPSLRVHFLAHEDNFQVFFPGTCVERVDF